MKEWSKKKKIIVICAAVAVALALIFVGFGVFFNSHFYFRSTINGVNASGATVKMATTRLTEATSDYVLTLETADEKTEKLTAEDLGMKIDVTEEEVASILEKQNGFLWVYRLFVPKEYMDDAMVSCDASAVKKSVTQLSCVKNKKAIATENAKVVYKDDAFVVEEEIYGTEVELKTLLKKVKKAANSLQETLNLTDEKCYVQPEYKADDKKVKKLVKTLNACADTKITYTIGSTTEKIEKKTLASWLSSSDDMEVAFDTDAMSDYVKTLAAKYDTYGQSKQLTTQYGVTVTVPGGNYGWRTDQSGEVKKLQEDILAGEDVSRDLVYQYTAASRDGNDYGNSYVEINRTAQHLYLVINGAVVLDTPVVTGNPNNGHTTPTGAYRITYCQRNATLRGDNYATPVSYWMPFNGDIGLHDATWQKAFGGQRYMEGYGSHGCVNLPISAAGTIYSYVSAGFPVLMYDLAGTETIDTLTQKAADDCKNAINAICSVTLDSYNAITSARATYEALTASGKGAVDNYQTLVDAENVYNALVAQSQAAADAKAQSEANTVIDLINQIGTVTSSSESAIDAAQNAYNALSDAAKAKVTNKAALDAAVAAYQAL